MSHLLLKGQFQSRTTSTANPRPNGSKENQFPEDATYRNTKRWPPTGKGQQTRTQRDGTFNSKQGLTNERRLIVLSHEKDKQKKSIQNVD